VLLVTVALLCLAIPASAEADAPVEAYGANDGGGFRNVLPAGENGLDNATQLAEFEASEQKKAPPAYPPHFADQLPLYAKLLYASPALTREQDSQLLQGRHVRRQGTRSAVG
jgi:hypothetical protein